MHQDAHRALVQRYVHQIWGDHAPSALRQLAATGYRRWIRPSIAPLTLDEQVKRLIRFQSAFPDARVEIEKIIVEDDIVVLRGILRGSHHAYFLNVPPSGGRVAVWCVDVFRVSRDGGITDQWGGIQTFELMQQLNEFNGPEEGSS